MSSHEPRAIASPRPLAIKETQLIDRAEEMRLLREAVDRAVHGQGGVVLLYGEAGIGKTRLARELAAYARLRGMRVLSGRCPALFRMDGVPPYILWKEVVKDYLETCTPEQLSRAIGYYPMEVSKLVPELKQILRTMPESFPLGPEHGRDRLFEAVSQFITNISKEIPLLVILDDLQWADESSLLLLHYLARGVHKEPLLLLGAYRDTDVNEKHPLIPVLTELNRERLLQSVQLKRMSFDDVSDMIKRILEQDDIPRKFCELIYDKTRGNPFFAEEVIKSLKEEGVVYREENKWKIKEVSKIEFPETVKSVIKKRISRLEDECQNVLTMASLVGNDFTFEALSAVAGIEESRLLELMERILKTGLFKHRVVRGEDVCSFADIIVRDVVYEEVNPFRRKKLHNVVGCALERIYAEKIDEHFGELAFHFLESGDKDKALDYFLKAAEKAARIYANSEAMSHLQSALRLLEEKDGDIRQKATVLEKLGDIKNIIGESDACIRHWNEALTIWDQLSEKEKASAMHRKIAKVLWDGIGDTEKAKEHQDKALNILITQPESAELASLYEDIAHMLWRTGEVNKALPWAEKALELAKKLDAHEVIARSYTTLGTIFSNTGDIGKAVECLERALKIALDNSFVEVALHAYNNLAVAFPEHEYERRLECYEKGFELAKKVGDIFYRSWIGANLSDVYFGMGNMDKVVPLVEESLELDRKAGNMTHLAMYAGALGFYYQVLGDWERSERCMEEARTLSRKLNDFQATSSSYGYSGWFHFDKGEYGQAKEYFKKMDEAFEKAGAKQQQMWALRFVIWTHIMLGELEQAGHLIHSLGDYAAKAKNREFIAVADVLRAMLLRQQEKWEESLEYFAKGLLEFEALGARKWNIYWFSKLVLFEYARAYLKRDQEGDKEKAHDLLDQALETFQKMGAKKDIEKMKAIYVETGRQEVSQPTPAVEVPSGPVATGHADLDNSLFGGIPSKYAVILTSPSCDERDSLVKSFLETGVKKGEATFYVTIDPTVVRTLAQELQPNFYLFVCNPQADVIVKSQSNAFNLKGVESLTEISIALTSAIRKIDPSLKGHRRICISVISDILLQHHAVQTRRWLAGLIPELRSEGFTILAVMDPEMHPAQEVRAVLDLFEGEINIQEKETEKDSGKYLKINKMSNRKYLANELLLKKEGQV